MSVRFASTPPRIIPPMPIHHALLSLLDRGESYGYELRAELERSVGPQWGQLNIGHVYQLLERLKRDRLIMVVRSEPQPRRNPRPARQRRLRPRVASSRASRQRARQPPARSRSSTTAAGRVQTG